MSAPTARQADALRELAHMCSAKAASMLARLIGDVGVLVDPPSLAVAQRAQLGWLFGGRDVHIVVTVFDLEGDVGARLWWVLKKDDAQRLGRRLLSRPSFSGPLASNVAAALGEAANIVASACSTALGTMAHTDVLPTTPEMRDTTVADFIGPSTDASEQTVLWAPFLSTNAPYFSGWLVLLLEPDARANLSRRLGV